MTTCYYFGIDAGNSKTQGLIADSEGHVLALIHAGGGNWEGIGLEGARAVYADVLARALATAGLTINQIAAAGYGLAGYDFPSDDARLRPVIESLGVPGPFFLENDTLIALRAGTSRPYGVVCISGAGSTKAGRNRAGRIFRTWGLASDFGDWGGGGDLCRAALAAVARAEKGISPPTALTAALLAHYGAADVTGLMELISRARVYRNDYTPLIFAVAAAGDPVATEILLHAGQGLARGINAVIRALDMQNEVFELVLAGGVFRAEYPLLRDTLAAEVRAFAPGVEIVRLTAPPVVGAVLLAMDEAGQSPDETIRQRLIAEVLAQLA
ncbi:MAG: ATPase [Anaerolineae bacterium]|nr:ATPase [Anaerolineae bacterium]